MTNSSSSAQNPQSKESALVSVHGLTKLFEGGRGVAEVSLTVMSGDVIGLVGPNGAGKTTTLRMLAGLVRPDGGSGYIMGRDVRRVVRGGMKNVGYMPQKLALYGDLSVRDNLRFRADIYRLSEPARRVAEVMADFGLEGRQRQPAGQLSGGWARRLQLAAALIHTPGLVLLDEPTAGLDADSRQDVWRRILRLAEGGTGIVVNTHDLGEAEQCSCVALFRAGRVLRQGAPESLVEAAPVRAALVRGEDLPALHRRLAGHAGVLSLRTQGRALRVLGEPSFVAGLLAGWEGARATAADVDLSDVMLLDELDHRADPGAGK